MATTLDLPEFYNHARVQYAVRHKTSGQLLGYALLLPGADAEDSLVRLVPWHVDDNLHHTTDAALGDVQNKLSLSHSSLPDHNQNLNMSTHSASEGSSLNNTMTSQCPSDLPVSEAEFNASVSLANLSTSTPSKVTILSTSPPTSAVFSRFGLARSVTSSKIGLLSGKSSPSTTLPGVPPSVKNSIDYSYSGIQEEKAVKCLVPKRKYSEMSVSDSDSKTKTLKPDEKKDAKVKIGDNLLAGGAGRKYDVFIEDVNPGVKLKDIKLKKVKCLLCGDGKIMSYGNRGRHFKRYHEPPVICEICHREFNVLQLEEHMANWHKAEDLEKNRIKSKSDVNELNLKPRKEGDSPLVPTLKPNTEVIRSSNIQPVKINQPILFPSDGSSLNSVRKPSNEGEASQLAEDYIALTLTSATDKGVFLKLGLEKGARVKKAMKIFGKKVNTDYRSLKFFLKNTELTGAEVVRDLQGCEVSVVGDLVK